MSRCPYDHDPFQFRFFLLLTVFDSKNHLLKDIAAVFIGKYVLAFFSQRHGHKNSLFTHLKHYESKKKYPKKQRRG